MPLFNHLFCRLATLCALGLPFAAIAAPAPPQQANNRSAVVYDTHIVIFKPGTSREALAAHRRASLQATSDESADNSHTYNLGKLVGYSGKLNPETTVDKLKADPNVAHVELDQEMWPAISWASHWPETERPPPWGVSRISQKKTGNFSVVNYDPSGGEGVNVYVLSTGVHLTHVDLEGRAVNGKNFISSEEDRDLSGLGTHVAGTVAGKTLGVAPKANIISVKVLRRGDAGGALSTFIAGIQWAVQDARSKGAAKKSVIHLASLTSKSDALNLAVDEAAAEGLTVVGPVGEYCDYASSYSPATAKGILTVSSLDKNNNWLEGYSNFGPEVDIYSPGVDIFSIGFLDKAGNTVDNGPGMLSGSGVAASHVAGLAAYLIKLEGLSGSDQVMARIRELAVKGAVNRVPDPSWPNLIAYNGGEELGSKVVS